MHTLTSYTCYSAVSASPHQHVIPQQNTQSTSSWNFHSSEKSQWFFLCATDGDGAFAPAKKNLCLFRCLWKIFYSCIIYNSLDKAIVRHEIAFSRNKGDWLHYFVFGWGSASPATDLSCINWHNVGVSVWIVLQIFPVSSDLDLSPTWVFAKFNRSCLPLLSGNSNLADV